MKKKHLRKLFFTLHIIGVLIAAFSLIVKLLFAQLETSVILWILSITLILPYLIYKQWRQENWTGKDLWPWLILAATGIIYLIINTK